MTDFITPSGSVGQVQAVAQGLAFSRAAQLDSAVPSSGVPPEGSSIVDSKNISDGKDKAARAEMAAKAEAKSKGPVPASLEEASSSLRKYLESLPSNLQFSADPDSGRYLFKVVNPVTREVIRQFPADEVLEMAKRIKQQLSTEGAGILLDEKL